MEYYKSNLYYKHDFCVFKNEELMLNRNLIPFFYDLEVRFYDPESGSIYDDSSNIYKKSSLLHLTQITTQENFIICNDEKKLYICTDNFIELTTFDIQIKSNFIVFGFDVYFIDDCNCKYHINLTTRILNKCSDSNSDTIKWLLNEGSYDISGFIDKEHANQLTICDSKMYDLSHDDNFKFGGAKVRVTHVVQLHYSKVFDNIRFATNDGNECWLYDIFENFMKDLCLSTKDIECNDNDYENIMKLFTTEYLNGFIEDNDIYTRDDHYNNRIILSSENDLLDDTLKEKVNEIFYGLYNSRYMPVGPFYYYAPLHALSWHTNMGDSGPETYRMYNVYCEKDYESFFCYKHPVSGLIHILGDKNMHTEVFNIGPVDKPFWHAVINPTKNVKRMSLGFMLDNDLEKIFTKEQLKAMLARYKE